MALNSTQYNFGEANLGHFPSDNMDMDNLMQRCTTVCVLHVQNYNFPLIYGGKYVDKLSSKLDWIFGHLSFLVDKWSFLCPPGGGSNESDTS